MNDQNPVSQWRRGATLVLAALLAANMWVYVQRIVIPQQISDAAAHNRPRGSLSDLYPRWLGARELLQHGRDPYSPAVTREIQRGYYGRPIDPSNPDDPQDQQAFAYPVFIVFLLAPTVNLPFTEVSRVFFWLLWVASGSSVLLWLRVLRWTPSKSTAAVLVLLTLSSIPFILGIKLEQITLLIAAALPVCALLMLKKHFGAAGALLALTTIKPQLVLPLIAWLMFWALNDWRQRKTLIFSFFLTLGVLFGAAEWILPGWIKEFYYAVIAYRQYTHAASLLDHLTNASWGPVFSALIFVVAAGICWRLRRDSEQSTGFLFAFVFVLTVTSATMPGVSTYNQALMLPAILLIISHGPSLWNQYWLSRVVWILAGAALFWPWIAALGLTAAFLTLPADRVLPAWSLPFYTGFAVPLAALGLLFQIAAKILPSKSRIAAGSQHL